MIFNMDSNNGMVSRFWPGLVPSDNAANAAKVAGGGALALKLKRSIRKAEAKIWSEHFSVFHLVRVFGIFLI